MPSAVYNLTYLQQLGIARNLVADQITLMQRFLRPFAVGSCHNILGCLSPKAHFGTILQVFTPTWQESFPPMISPAQIMCGAMYCDPYMSFAEQIVSL